MPVERTTPQLVKKGKGKKDLDIVDRVDIKVAEVVEVVVQQAELQPVEIMVVIEIPVNLVKALHVHLEVLKN